MLSNAATKITAAGFLARAALGLHEGNNPAATPQVPDEPEIRAEFLAELGSRLKDVREDEEVEALDAALDVEIDALLGAIDEATIFGKLANEGQLPSDLYKVEIHSDIVGFWGLQFGHEKPSILATVSESDAKQHLGADAKTGDATLVSLFTKHFSDRRFPGRNFTMLVAGLREGDRFIVHQAWRVYSDQVDLQGTTSLVEVLERFAQRFGVNLNIGQVTGKFILKADVLRPEDVNFNIADGIVHSGTHQVYLFAANRRDAKRGTFVSLALAIDLHRYRNALRPFYGMGKNAKEFAVPSFMRSRWLPFVDAA